MILWDRKKSPDINFDEWYDKTIWMTTQSAVIWKFEKRVNIQGIEPTNSVVT